MKLNIRILYLYLFSFIGLLIIVMGSIRIVDLGIKTFIFPDADVYEAYPVSLEEPQVNKMEMVRYQETDRSRQKQRDLSNALSMIIVGAPLYLYHWKTIQKENSKDKLK